MPAATTTPIVFPGPVLASDDELLELEELLLDGLPLLVLVDGKVLPLLCFDWDEELLEIAPLELPLLFEATGVLFEPPLLLLLFVVLCELVASGVLSAVLI